MKHPTMMRPTESPQKRAVNGCWLRYSTRRRMTDGFKGDMNIPARRRACNELVKWFEGCAADDMRVTMADIQRAFDGAMERIPDITTGETHASTVL
jgi:hypothetical protein